jgi:hypothetical protein
MEGTVDKLIVEIDDGSVHYYLTRLRPPKGPHVIRLIRGSGRFANTKITRNLLVNASALYLNMEFHLNAKERMISIFFNSGNPEGMSVVQYACGNP